MPGPWYEEFRECPYCGDYFEEAIECSTCGKAIPISYGKDRFNLCESCEIKAQKALEAYLEEFTSDEKRYLNWVYEGRGF